MNDRPWLVTDYEWLVDCSDAGNATLLIELARGRLRFDHRRKRWFWWDDLFGEWQEDAKSGEHALHAALLVGRYWASAARGYAAVNSRLSREFAQWAVRSRSRSGINNMLAMASHHDAMRLDSPTASTIWADCPPNP
jgi:hypothetical protein